MSVIRLDITMGHLGPIQEQTEDWFLQLMDALRPTSHINLC